MEETGQTGADGSGFRACFSLVRKSPIVIRLSFSAAISGLLYGLDTGIISGALLYIRDDFKSVDKKTDLQGLIVSMAVFGGIIGAATGGWASDRFGRRTLILVTDLLSLIGSVIMASAPNPALLITGRLFIGISSGISTMISPLYISEASPAKIRGALISTNGFLVTVGQFVAFLISLAFTKVPGTWRWMLGVSGIPALVQFGLMLTLPESPRWLYRKGRQEEAIAILGKIYSSHEVEREILHLRDSVEAETNEEGSLEKISLRKLWETKTIRRGLIAGVGLQTLEQFVGINAVLYYSPTIFQLAGFASNKIAVSLSLITSGLNIVGAIIGIYFIDRTGRKKLLLFSLAGIIVSLGILSAVFHVTASHSPNVSRFESSLFHGYTCSDFQTDSTSWDCMKCLKAPPPFCGFCASGSDELLPGACLISNSTVKDLCHGKHRAWYTRGCPSRFGWFALVGMGLYIISFSPGATVPWILIAEIYPLRSRGVCCGIAATANWVSNLIIAQFFLSLTQAIGTSLTFLIFGVISVVTLLFVLVFVPETKGLPIEEVERMLERRSLNLLFWKKSETVCEDMRTVGNVEPGMREMYGFQDKGH